MKLIKWTTIDSCTGEATITDIGWDYLKANIGLKQVLLCGVDKTKTIKAEFYIFPDKLLSLSAENLQNE